MTKMFIPPLGGGARHQPNFERQVEAHVRRRISRSPHTVAPSVYELIRSEGGEIDDNILLDAAEQGTPAARAGILSSRVPGVRDPIHAGHPIDERMRAHGLASTMLSGPAVADWPTVPTGRDEIRIAVLHRWRPLSARGCELHRLYTGDPAYDADHSSDGLMRQTLDVDLAAFVDLLVGLEEIDPAMFRAVWLQEASEVERLLALHRQRLPEVRALEAISDKQERVRTMVGMFWELERGFEFLYTVGGGTRMTHATLGAALRSTTALTNVFGSNTRDGRYLVDSWMHFLPLQELMRSGSGTHPGASPWRAYGPAGNPAAVDHHAGLSSAAGHTTLSRAHSVVAPFVRHHGHRQVQNVAPASFIYGWDAQSLAVAMLLQIASTLPDRHGRWLDRQSDLVLSHRGAFGRLAMLVLANICPDTAWAALCATVDAPNNHGVDEQMETFDEAPAYGPTCLDDVIANFDAWYGLMRDGQDNVGSARERRSMALGRFAFDNMVKTVGADLNRIIPAEESAPNYELGFHPPAWWSTFDPRPNLREAAKRVPPKYKERLPACYKVVDGQTFEFCVDMAAEIRAGKPPNADDPSYLYGPDPKFALGQFGACGQPKSAIRSAVLAAKADKIVDMADRQIVPRLKFPTPITLGRRERRRERARKGKTR